MKLFNNFYTDKIHKSHNDLTLDPDPVGFIEKNALVGDIARDTAKGIWRRTVHGIDRYGLNEEERGYIGNATSLQDKVKRQDEVAQMVENRAERRKSLLKARRGLERAVSKTRQNRQLDRKYWLDNKAILHDKETTYLANLKQLNDEKNKVTPTGIKAFARDVADKVKREIDYRHMQRRSNADRFSLFDDADNLASERLGRTTTAPAGRSSRFRVTPRKTPPRGVSVKVPNFARKLLTSKFAPVGAALTAGGILLNAIGSFNEGKALSTNITNVPRKYRPRSVSAKGQVPDNLPVRDAPPAPVNAQLPLHLQ